MLNLQTNLKNKIANITSKMNLKTSVV